MNILVINHYAGSIYHGMGYRSFYLAREWVKLGHDVTIISSAFSHLFHSCPKISGPFTVEYIDGIRYIWINTPRYSENGCGRIWNMAVFSWKIWWGKVSNYFSSDPEIVIASSAHPFIIFGALRISRLYHAKLIFEVRDLWPLTLIELGGHSPYHPFIMLMQKVEIFAYRHAELVVSVLPGAQEYMVNHFMLPEKFRYCPNGILPDEWREAPFYDQGPAENILRQLKDEGKFIIGYTGAHGLANALSYLIEAASIMKEAPVAFVFVGQGPEKEKLHSAAKGNNNVFFLSQVPKTNIPNILSLFDLCYIGWLKQPIYKYGISPNKIMDYMMAGKPILHAVDTTFDCVQESECGISIEPENSFEIVRAINIFLAMPPEQLRKMGERGRCYVKEKHNYQKLAAMYMDWMKVGSNSVTLKQ